MPVNNAGGLSPSSIARSATAKTFNKLAWQFVTTGFVRPVAALNQSSNLASSRKSAVVSVAKMLGYFDVVSWFGQLTNADDGCSDSSVGVGFGFKVPRKRKRLARPVF